MQGLKSLPLERRMELYNQAIKLRRENSWGGIKIGKTIGVSESTVNNWINRKKRKKPDRTFNHPTLNSSMDLSYLLGAYYGDGCASFDGNGYSITLVAKDKEFVDEFSRCLSKVLNKDFLYPVRMTSRGFYRTDARSVLLYNFLKKPLDIHKPIIEKNPAPFIKGFFDAEGSISKGNRCYGLVASNTDLILLQYLKELLSRHFSISMSIHYQKPTISYLNGRKIIPQKDNYILRTASRENLLKFYKEIGFTIKRKQDKLVQAVF